MPNFSEALNIKAGDVEPPALIPAGHYIFRVSARHRTSEIQGKDDTYERVEIPCEIVSVETVPDEDALEAFGDVTGQKLRVSFLFPKGNEANFKRTLFNLTRFLTEHCEIQSDDPDVTIDTLLEESLNAQFLGTVTHRPDNRDPERVYAEITKTAPVA